MIVVLLTLVIMNIGFMVFVWARLSAVIDRSINLECRLMDEMNSIMVQLNIMSITLREVKANGKKER